MLYLWHEIDLATAQCCRSTLLDFFSIRPCHISRITSNFPIWVMHVLSPEEVDRLYKIIGTELLLPPMLQWVDLELQWEEAHVLLSLYTNFLSKLSRYGIQSLCFHWSTFWRLRYGGSIHQANWYGWADTTYKKPILSDQYLRFQKVFPLPWQQISIQLDPSIFPVIRVLRPTHVPNFIKIRSQIKK